MRTLYVAAGGGGDAVGALLARRALGDTDERPPLVTTCAWERLRIDPVPGPRARADFTGLGLVGGEPFEVLPTTDTLPSGRSVLPRLAETSGARIFLHDFEDGAVGLSGQLQRLAASLEVDKLVVVDVGGDIVARGPEPDLRSPLADSLTLAAALGTGIPMSVVVLGPGADAELPQNDVIRLLGGVGAVAVGSVTADDVRDLQPVLSWHPTEATALTAAGAEGVRGAVAMRRGREPVPVTEFTASVWVIRNPTVGSFPLALALLATENLSQAERVVRTLAVNEIDFEREIAEDRKACRFPVGVTGLMAEMKGVGATHITDRRLSEALGRETRNAVGSRHGTGGLWSIADLASLMRMNSRSR